ncbi:MAG: CoA-binding protein [Terriglobales bacterium]|jgi:predicted CoA-binding protein|nr:CoA-binding protein [Terriglobales bacterium]
MNSKAALNDVHTVLVIDWPSIDVPESLAFAGFQVVVRGGPGPEDYSAYELKNGAVIPRHVGRPPEHVDLIYSHRPLGELPQIIELAKKLGAKTIWTQSGLSAAGKNDPKGCWASEEDLRSARDLAQSAGLNYLSQPYIGDTAREVKASQSA